MPFAIAFDTAFTPGCVPSPYSAKPEAIIHTAPSTYMKNIAAIASGLVRALPLKAY